MVRYSCDWPGGGGQQTPFPVFLLMVLGLSVVAGGVTFLSMRTVEGGHARGVAPGGGESALETTEPRPVGGGGLREAAGEAPRPAEVAQCSPAPAPAPVPPVVVPAPVRGGSEALDPFWDRVAFVIRSGENVMEKRIGAQLLSWAGRVRHTVWVSDHSVESPYAFSWRGEGLVHPKTYDGTKGRWFHKDDKFNQPNSGPWDKDFVKHLAAIYYLWQDKGGAAHPNVDWFMMVDDDTYVILPRLKAVIERSESTRGVDPRTKKVVFALCYGLTDTEPARECGRYPTDGSAYYTAGGGGTLISRAAMEAVIPLIDTCVAKYAPCWAGDRRLGACFFDAGVACDRGSHYDSRDIAQDLVGQPKASRPMFLTSVHKMQPLTMLFIDWWAQYAVEPAGHIDTDALVAIWPILQNYDLWAKTPHKGRTKE